MNKTQTAKFNRIKEEFEGILCGRRLSAAIAAAQTSDDPGVLMRLANYDYKKPFENEWWFVVYCACRNPHIPSWFLEKKGTKDPHAKAGMAENMTTPYRMLKQLAEDQDQLICEKASKTIETKRLLDMRRHGDHNIYMPKK